MKRIQNIFYVCIGFCLGAITGSSHVFDFKSSYAPFFVSAVLLAAVAVLIWTDATGRNWIHNNLALIRGKEKTRFIILYNILERGSVLFLIAIVLHLTTSGLTRAVFISLAPITIILAAALLYFGHQEWLEDELMEMRRNIYSKN